MSIASSTRRLLVLPQIKQQLPELLFSGSACTAFHTLTTQVHQFGDTVPACASSGGVLAICQELLSVFAGLCNVFLGLLGVAGIKVVQALPRRFYCLFLFGF